MASSAVMAQWGIQNAVWRTMLVQTVEGNVMMWNVFLHYDLNTHIEVTIKVYHFVYFNFLNDPVLFFIILKMLTFKLCMLSPSSYCNNPSKCWIPNRLVRCELWRYPLDWNCFFFRLDRRLSGIEKSVLTIRGEKERWR